MQQSTKIHSHRIFHMWLHICLLFMHLPDILQKLNWKGPEWGGHPTTSYCGTGREFQHFKKGVLNSSKRIWKQLYFSSECCLKPNESFFGRVGATKFVKSWFKVNEYVICCLQSKKGCLVALARWKQSKISNVRNRHISSALPFKLNQFLTVFVAPTRLKNLLFGFGQHLLEK